MTTLNMKKLVFYFALYSVFSISILWLPYWGIGVGCAEPVFSITADNESLGDVLAKVSKSTGYKIEITKGWENKPVTVSLKRIALEKGLRDIMRMADESNYALVVNDKMKKVEIRIFGDASSVKKQGQGTYVGTRADFSKRERIHSERELIDVRRPVPENPEEPPEVEVMPPDMDLPQPEIEMRHPEMDRRHPD